MDIRILSAEHGLLHPETEIEYYDRRMNPDRAKELHPELVTELRNLITEEEYERVIINMGREYQRAIYGFDEGLNVVVDIIDGNGIGHKGHVLKRVVRGDDSALGVAN